MSTQEGQIPQGQGTPEQQVDWEKRYKDLQSYSDRNRAILEAELKQLRKSNTVFTPPKTPEELEAFKRENPDWMGVIETVAHQIASTSVAPLQAEVNRSKAQAAAAQLLAAHPDVADIYASEDFKQWASEQGAEIQGWLEEEHDATKVIRALNYYKAMRRPSVQHVETNSPAHAAAAVRTHGSVVTPRTETIQRRFTRQEINRMHPDEYKANYEAIMAQAQAGLL